MTQQDPKPAPNAVAQGIPNPGLDPIPGGAPGTIYLLTVTGGSDDMPMGLFADPRAALALVHQAGYIPLEPLPAFDAGGGLAALASNTARGASIVWGCGPSVLMGYKLSKFVNGRLCDVAIWAWEDCEADVNEDTEVGRATLREWCRANWTLPLDFN